MATEGVKWLLGIGNPMLDISAVVDEEFLRKYNVQLNKKIESEPQHDTMYQELADKENVKYSTREATLYSVKVAQWILEVPGATSYIGYIGKDKFGAEMKKNLKALGVNIHYCEDETQTTNKNAILLVGGQSVEIRSSSKTSGYKSENFKSPENWALVEKAKFFYISGFFILVSPESIQLVAEHAAEKAKIFMMNLADYALCYCYNQEWMKFFPYIDYVFGDETEARFFAMEQGWETDNVGEIALNMSALPKATETHSRIAVITQGADPVVVAKDGKVTLFPVTIPMENTVAACEAGDAFVGGFLAQLVLGKSMMECVRGELCGKFYHSTIVQRSGCTCPKRSLSVGLCNQCPWQFCCSLWDQCICQFCCSLWDQCICQFYF